MFEHYSKPLASKQTFTKRLLKYFLFGLFSLTFSILIGMLGFKFLADLNWVDAFYNAAMNLTGEGPVSKLHSNSAKIFSGCYAIYGGVAFLSSFAIILAPITHRFLHIINIEN